MSHGYRGCGNLGAKSRQMAVTITATQTTPPTIIPVPGVRLTLLRMETCIRSKESLRRNYGERIVDGEWLFGVWLELVHADGHFDIRSENHARICSLQTVFDFSEGVCLVVFLSLEQGLHACYIQPASVPSCWVSSCRPFSMIYLIGWFFVTSLDDLLLPFNSFVARLQVM
jgi:hypothetical protein